ncbi:cation:proton antiporter [Mucilaginibacter daejeonensis]|uniref:cation:proton antiporter n=1 Tax=Mucilaginibacter daejeonensis TaxID=398049 RepID=UPI001D176AE6|nr:cation:proton antiporter [Mucilaginibacter daejeonensis]UEG55107.1 cation:proton antiporter [Mucilaginibacter daejeonensis]
MHSTNMDQYLQYFQLPITNPVLVFAIILLVILISPLALTRIRIPAVVGFILAGMIISPNGLNILKKNSAIELFSTIGLLYIMFIAGIELDLNDLRKRKNKSLLFGALTFFMPIMVGFPVCYYGLGYPVITSILTASMFATHTLVAYPIVSRYQVAKNEAVAITVGGTILTDTAVLIILAVVIDSKHGGLTTAFWLRLVMSLLAFSAVQFLLVPRIAKWFFSRAATERTSHYIFVLFIVFLSAFLAQLAGIEPIVGAFAAGLALNRSVPHDSKLMEQIEFVGHAIFIPFFLISVGMLVDLRVLFKGYHALMIAGVLTTVALASKWISAWATQTLFKYTAPQRGLIFGLSASHAAATMAIILVGFKAGIIDEFILNGTVILILCTCMVASFATERAARRVAAAQQSKEQRVPEQGMLS